jgi:hypothetical protein
MVEVTLVIISYVSKMPNDTYEITGVAIQIARILILVLLPCLYLRLRNRKDEYGNSDAEAQSLLRKKLAPNLGSSEDEAENQTGYGTTAQVSSASSVTAAAEEEEEEDEYLKQQEESKQKMAKRLEADGNWWTYARAFTVCPQFSQALQIPITHKTDRLIDILPLHLAGSQQEAPVSSAPSSILLTCDQCHERIDS